jgi:hypothetical protein
MAAGANYQSFHNFFDVGFLDLKKVTFNLINLTTGISLVNQGIFFVIALEIILNT